MYYNLCWLAVRLHIPLATGLKALVWSSVFCFFMTSVWAMFIVEATVPGPPWETKNDDEDELGKHIYTHVWQTNPIGCIMFTICLHVFAINTQYTADVIVCVWDFSLLLVCFSMPNIAPELDSILSNWLFERTV